MQAQRKQLTSGKKTKHAKKSKRKKNEEEE
jgi:hypothetical protein